MRVETWLSRGAKVRCAVVLGAAALLGAPALRAGEVILSAELTPPVRPAEAWFGVATALSGDGRTALVGASQEDCAAGDRCGAAYVFSVNSGVWAFQAKLTAPVPEALGSFGRSVALSEDGHTALIRGAGDCVGGAPNGCESGYVFVRSGSTWTGQAELRTTGSVAPGASLISQSVALSSNGDVALVGTFGSCMGLCGAVGVFRRSGGTWAEETVLTGLPNDLSFGNSVAISGDGNTALVGNPFGVGGGDVQVYAHSGGVWTEQAPLVPTSQPFRDGAGTVVVLSADGRVAAVNQSASCIQEPPFPCDWLYLFEREGSGWVERQLITTQTAFGSALALSADGSALVAGGFPANQLLRRNGNTWVRDLDLLLPGQDGGVGISTDGREILTGTPFMDCDAGDACGAAYITGLGVEITDVPTLGGVGLMMLAGLLAAGGAVLLRRRREA